MRPKPLMSRARRIAGYGVFDHGGNLIWGCLRSTKEAAKAAFLANNPQIEGFETAYRVVPIAVELEDYHQTDLEM